MAPALSDRNAKTEAGIDFSIRCRDEGRCQGNRCRKNATAGEAQVGRCWGKGWGYGGVRGRGRRGEGPLGEG